MKFQLKKAQELRSKQNNICSKSSFETLNINGSVDKKSRTNKINHIKIKDFEKEKEKEKMRNKITEKKRIKKNESTFFLIYD